MRGTLSLLLALSVGTIGCLSSCDGVLGGGIDSVLADPVDSVLSPPVDDGEEAPEPPSGSLHWYDGDDIDGSANSTLTPGGRVATWVDKGSLAQNATQATDANRPTFASGGHVTCDGNDWLKTTTGSTQAQPYTICAVWSTTTMTGQQTVVGSANAGAVRHEFGTITANMYAFANAAASRTASPAVTIVGGDVNAACVYYSDAASTFDLNGSTVNGVFNAALGAAGSNGITLCALLSTSFPLTGSLHEVLMYAGDESDSTMAYFTGKYGSFPQ